MARTPVNLQKLQDWISIYHNPSIGQVLLEGFSQGFKIPFQGIRERRVSKNHSSASQQADLVMKKLMEEVELGRVAGPFNDIPIDNLIVSPIGLVPKSTPGEFRLIFDLSFPHGSSINDGIPQDCATVAYTSFDAVTSMVRHEGQGSHLVKVDIKSAFRLLPIHPQDFCLLGMKANEKFFVDKCLPFGLSVSCALFEKFSSFLEWCLRTAANSDQIIHYLDDFCGCALQQDSAQHMLNVMLQTFMELGVPVAEDKVEGPSTSIRFLGLVVDTVAMQVRIPEDKLSDLKQLVTDTLTRYKKKITLRQLQSLLGKLNFACRAVVPGRAFCRRLIDATMGLKKPHHKVRVTASMVEDLKVWQSFLEHYNGNNIIFEEQWQHNTQLELFTDAAGTIGFGAYFQGHWAFGAWPKTLLATSPDITFKELLPIVVALHLWGSHFSNCKVIFHCDNQAVVHIINKQSTRSKPSMHLVRLLVSVCLSQNILFKAQHIPGCRNNVADALSRFQMDRFRALAPDADPKPTPIPPALWQQLVRKYPD